MGPSLSNSSSTDLASPDTSASDPCLLSESASTEAKAGLLANRGFAATTLAAEVVSLLFASLEAEGGAIVDGGAPLLV